MNVGTSVRCYPRGITSRKSVRRRTINECENDFAIIINHYFRCAMAKMPHYPIHRRRQNEFISWRRSPFNIYENEGKTGVFIVANAQFCSTQPQGSSGDSCYQGERKKAIFEEREKGTKLKRVKLWSECSISVAVLRRWYYFKNCEVKSEGGDKAVRLNMLMNPTDHQGIVSVCDDVESRKY